MTYIAVYYYCASLHLLLNGFVEYYQAHLLILLSPTSGGRKSICLPRRGVLETRKLIFVDIKCRLAQGVMKSIIVGSRCYRAVDAEGLGNCERSSEQTPRVWTTRGQQFVRDYQFELKVLELAILSQLAS